MLNRFTVVDQVVSGSILGGFLGYLFIYSIWLSTDAHTIPKLELKGAIAEAL